MRALTFLITFMLLVPLSGCDQTPEQVYAPPALTGKAYVLAGADHIAVVDLATTAVSRIKMDKKGLDLAISNKQLYVLAEDGTIATLKDEKSLTPWQEGLPGGMAMAAGPDNTLWLLGKGELRQFVAGKGLAGEGLKINGDYSSLFFGETPDTVWLVSRKTSTATPFNLTRAMLGPAVAKIGNSVHQGLAFSGAGELWLAEGNEYMDGEPYGVGYVSKNTPAMPGGVNIIDLQSGSQSDFIIVGGNVVDLAISPSQDKVYAAVSQLPEYVEATLSLIDAKSRRVTAELRLCLSCHQNTEVKLNAGQGQVRALAIFW